MWVRVMPKGMDLYMFSFGPASLPEGLFNKESFRKGSLRSFGILSVLCGLCCVGGEGRRSTFMLSLVWTKSDKAYVCGLCLSGCSRSVCVRMLMLKFCCFACFLLCLLSALSFVVGIVLVCMTGRPYGAVAPLR